MSKALPIAQVEISCFAHATEDEGKVLSALKRLLPEGQVADTVFEKNKMQGHHGNPIMLFESKVMEKSAIRALIENLASNLGSSDKEILLNEFEMHFEKGSLYIRLDKQAAFLGEFRLGAADPVRVRLRFRKNRLEDVVEICREVGLIPR